MGDWTTHPNSKRHLEQAPFMGDRDDRTTQVPREGERLDGGCRHGRHRRRPNVIALPKVQWRMSTAWTHRSTCSRPHDDMILGAYEALPSICEGRSTMAWPRPTSTASRITVSREERD